MKSLPTSSLQILSAKLPTLDLSETQREEVSGTKSHRTQGEKPSLHPGSVWVPNPRASVRNQECYLGRDGKGVALSTPTLIDWQPLAEERESKHRFGMKEGHNWLVTSVQGDRGSAEGPDIRHSLPVQLFLLSPYIIGQQNIAKWGLLPVLIKFYWNTALLICILSTTTLAVWPQNGDFATETTWFTKPKIYRNCPFKEKVCQPLL